MTTSNKKMTLEKLAQLSQEQFLEIQGDVRSLRQKVATKDDLRVIQEEMATKEQLRTEIRQLRGDIQADVREAVKEVIQEEVKQMNYAPEIDKLSSRVSRIEKHLGVGTK